MVDKETLKLVLDALKDIDYDKRIEAIKALEEALSKQEQGALVADSSAWWSLVMNAAASIEEASWSLRDEDSKRQAVGAAKHYREAAHALYTHPQPKQEPTSGDWYAADDIDRMVRELDIVMNGKNAASQAKLCDLMPQLREKLSQPKQEQGEPVAWPMEHQPDGSITPVDPADMTPEQLQLYTTPQQPVIDKSAAIRIATALGWTPPKQDHGERCIWRQTDDINMPDTWEADCGAMWTFTEGGPKNNDMNFCPNCGKSVIEADHDVKE